MTTVTKRLISGKIQAANRPDFSDVVTIHEFTEAQSAGEVRILSLIHIYHLVHQGVDPALFPKDAVYTQVPPGFFQKYKFHLVVLGALLLLLVSAVVMRLRWFMQRQRQQNREFQLLSQYRKLVDNMPVIYLRKRIAGGSSGSDFEFLDVNPAFEQVFGCTRRQILGKRLSEALSCRDKLSCLAETEQTVHSFVVDGAKGLRYYDKLVFSSSEAGIKDVFCIDRTEEHLALARMERHRAEQEELNEKYKLVLQATGLTPWTWDVEMCIRDSVETSLPGIRLLEVEPAEDELTTRRVAFYRRNGYRIVDRSYVQPSYENFGDAAPLWIMGNDTPERLPEFIERIKKEVYRDPLAR